MFKKMILSFVLTGIFLPHICLAETQQRPVKKVETIHEGVIQYQGPAVIKKQAAPPTDPTEQKAKEVQTGDESDFFPSLPQSGSSAPIDAYQQAQHAVQMVQSIMQNPLFVKIFAFANRPGVMPALQKIQKSPNHKLMLWIQLLTLLLMIVVRDVSTYRAKTLGKKILTRLIIFVSYAVLAGVVTPRLVFGSEYLFVLREFIYVVSQ